jgi:hypothetical protein
MNHRLYSMVVSSWIFFLSRIVLRRALYIQGRLGGGQTSSINTHGLACRTESYSIFVVGQTSCGICDRTIVVRKSRVLAPAPSRRALPCSPCRALAPARALLSTRSRARGTDELRCSTEGTVSRDRIDPVSHLAALVVLAFPGSSTDDVAQA